METSDTIKIPSPSNLRYRNKRGFSPQSISPHNEESFTTTNIFFSNQFSSSSSSSSSSGRASISNEVEAHNIELPNLSPVSCSYRRSRSVPGLGKVLNSPLRKGKTTSLIVNSSQRNLNLRRTLPQRNLQGGSISSPRKSVSSRTIPNKRAIRHDDKIRQSGSIDFGAESDDGGTSYRNSSRIRTTRNVDKSDTPGRSLLKSYYYRENRATPSFIFSRKLKLQNLRKRARNRDAAPKMNRISENSPVTRFSRPFYRPIPEVDGWVYTFFMMRPVYSMVLSFAILFFVTLLLGLRLRENAFRNEDFLAVNSFNENDSFNDDYFSDNSSEEMREVVRKAQEQIKLDTIKSSPKNKSNKSSGKLSDTEPETDEETCEVPLDETEANENSNSKNIDNAVLHDSDINFGDLNVEESPDSGLF